MAEDSLVSYWEKFGAIAFDQSQKAILTSCTLKNPHDDDDDDDDDENQDNDNNKTDKSKDGVVVKKAPKKAGDSLKPQQQGLRKCCFSFTIRRDIHNM